MSEFATVRKKLADQRGGEDISDLKPCRICGTPTPHATLVMLGARCSACYAEYCRFGNPPAARRARI